MGLFFHFQNTTSLCQVIGLPKQSRLCQCMLSYKGIQKNKKNMKVEKVNVDWISKIFELKDWLETMLDIDLKGVMIKIPVTLMTKELAKGLVEAGISWANAKGTNSNLDVLLPILGKVCNPKEIASTIVFCLLNAVYEKLSQKKEISVSETLGAALCSSITSIIGGLIGNLAWPGFGWTFGQFIGSWFWTGWSWFGNYWSGGGQCAKKLA